MDSPYVLILTNPEDYHAFVISECLRRKGVPHGLWYASDFPSLQSASIWLAGRSERWAVKGPDFSLLSTIKPSTIWLRRPGRPVLPLDLDPADRPFAYRECQAFLGGLQRLFGEEAFWVNPPAGFARANLKVEQLRSAIRNGLRIPETLMSNNAAEIRRFVSKKSEGVIYKAFFPFSWKTPDGVAALFSSLVREDDLPDDVALASTPGIFQEIIEKAYELRITVIGEAVYAVKIDSQQVKSARTDWRAALEQVPLERYDLPVSVEQAIGSIMVDLGIVFGCFDLIVTPSGDYVFLEVNEMGAFLWLEEQLPELFLADAFCELLLQGSRNFQRSPGRARVSLREVHDAALSRMRDSASHLHVSSEEEALPG